MANRSVMPFIEFRDGRNSYDLVCPICKAQGEIGVKPDKTLMIECPDKCGAMFLQRFPKSLFAKPVLEYVLGGKNKELTPVFRKVRNPHA